MNSAQRRWTITTIAASMALALALTGCGGNDETNGGSSASTQVSTPSATGASNAPGASGEPGEGTETGNHPEVTTPTESEAEVQGTVIEVRIRDGQVEPNGDRVRVEAGEPFTFRVDSDVPGSLHAHSTPEQSIEFTAGTTARRMVIDQPGIVEVELHEPPLVVVQLEVR